MLVRPPGASTPSPRPLLVSVDLRAGRVRVTGELDRSCAHHLLDALAALALTTHPVWTVDGRGVTFCDTEGLRVLARAEVLAASRRRGLRLVATPPFLAHLLGLAGLGHLSADGLPGTGSARVVPCGPGRHPAVRSTVLGRAPLPPSGWAARARTPETGCGPG
ncbi:STAS domain-containing protein [Geodermatophilus sp. SYSU D00079]